jgi:putative flippase GtrA
MRAVRAPEKHSIVGFGPKLLMRFGLVGIAATALYAILATIFMNRIGLSAVQASLAAYAAAARVSFLADKSRTVL